MESPAPSNASAAPAPVAEKKPETRLTDIEVKNEVAKIRKYEIFNQTRFFVIVEFLLEIEAAIIMTMIEAMTGNIILSESFNFSMLE